MKQLSIKCAWFATTLAALAPRTAAAQETSADTDPKADVVSAPADAGGTEETDAHAWTYPKTYSVRPLTMERGMVRANGILTLWDDGVDTVFGMTLGGSIGVLDDLELGINNYRVGSSLQQRYEGLIPVIFTPSAGFGNMPVYGRYRFVNREKLDFAGDVIFVLPVDSAFALEVALPFRIKPNDRLSVDTGLEVRGTFGSAKYADIRIPAIVNYNFSDRAFISGETGVQFLNLGQDFNTAPNDTQGVAFPIDFRAGGTWKRDTKYILDLFAGFAFPQLFEVGTSRSTVDFGIWDLFVGVAFYTRPLF